MYGKFILLPLTQGFRDRYLLYTFLEILKVILFFNRGTRWEDRHVIYFDGNYLWRNGTIRRFRLSFFLSLATRVSYKPVLSNHLGTRIP